ncbi:MAG: hypothetical protein M1167_08005 [Chloroflexi bacterium]|nr:hypothetical protein [Chloroflexota bacterium]
MQQKLLLKTELSQTTASLLTFKVPDIDGLFPGFKSGDFAVIYGSQSATSLMSRLCIRAQLPKQLGGLESKVVFIDAANSSSLSNILQAAELQHLDPETTLGNVINMRAYTAYRLTSLIMEKLEEAVETSDAKLVVISDIACSFLNDNVDDQEAKAVYGQIMTYLASFAKRHRIIIIATYLPHESYRRNSTLQEISTAKANVVLRFTKTPYTSEVELEKHQSYMLGVVEFTPEIKSLTDFAATNGQNTASTLSYKIL